MTTKFTPAQGHSVADLFSEYAAFYGRFEDREEAIIAAQLGITPDEAEAIGAKLVKPKPE